VIFASSRIGYCCIALKTMSYNLPARGRIPICSTSSRHEVQPKRAIIRDRPHLMRSFCAARGAKNVSSRQRRRA
jgi:hypothetical protein